MSEEKQERKPKWDQPEIEDFSDENNQLDEQGRQKGGNPNYGGCRPMAVGMWMCRPNTMCYPSSGAWMCRPRRPCYPHAEFHSMNPYCRPNGFNYGYGCYPRG